MSTNVNTNTSNTITINKSVLYGVLVGFIAVAVFAAGIFTMVGINYHNRIVDEAASQEMALEQSMAERKAKVEERLREFESATSNINRDLNADLYAIQIYSISEIASQYQTAKMSDTLSTPDVRTKIYADLENAIDYKTQEYIDDYSLAYEAAWTKYMYYKEGMELNDNQKVTKENLRKSAYAEKQWQDYNKAMLINMSNDLKTDLGNKLLSNVEELF